MLRENLSIKKCTTELLEFVDVVSFCPPPSTSARHWNLFFLAMLKKHSDRIITYGDILFLSVCVCDVLCWSLRSPLTMLVLRGLQKGCLSLAHAAFQNPFLKGIKATAFLFAAS